MNAGTIFVLCLAAGLVAFVVYLARLSRQVQRSGDAQGRPPDRKTAQQEPSERPPLKRAG
jgi:hypothetical protein